MWCVDAVPSPHLYSHYFNICILSHSLFSSGNLVAIISTDLLLCVSDKVGTCNCLAFNLYQVVNCSYVVLCKPAVLIDLCRTLTWTYYLWRHWQRLLLLTTLIPKLASSIFLSMITKQPYLEWGYVKMHLLPTARQHGVICQQHVTPCCMT